MTLFTGLARPLAVALVILAGTALGTSQTPSSAVRIVGSPIPRRYGDSAAPRSSGQSGAHTAS